MGKRINIVGLSEIRTAPLAAKLAEEKAGQGLILTTSAKRAKRIASDLAFFSDLPVHILPDLETARFMYEAKSTAELDSRVAAMAAMGGEESCIVVAPVLGALKKLPPREFFFADAIELEVGGFCEREELTEALLRMGYERSYSAEAPGQFALRGDIVDVFPPQSGDPVRIELFDTEVDSLRSFDSLSQRSNATLERLRILPAQVMVRDDKIFAEGLKAITSAYSRTIEKAGSREQLEKLRKKRDYLIDCIEEDINRQYLEGFISYFYEKPAFIWEYASRNSFIIVDDPARIEEVLDFYEKQQAEDARQMLERFSGIAEDLDSYPGRRDILKLREMSERCDIYYCTPFAQNIEMAGKMDERIELQVRQAPVFNGHMDVLSRELARYVDDGYRIVIACSSEERIANLSDFFEREDLGGRVELCYGRLTQGSEFPEEKILYLSESDIFVHIKSASKQRKSSKAKIRAFTDIRKGDYVVHEAHGVGRFAGVQMLSVDGSERDYLRIEYAGEDLLYVPVDQMDNIQKYVGSEGATPRINRLSGLEWQKTKARAKAAIKDMAEDLLKLSAERELNPGHRFGPDSAWQKEFEEAFPYEETADQLRCIEEIKADMESDKAMDRLLCGDVGYGKTEVAARAIFKCLEDGKQAAVLVPTTILANQHYNTFRERFSKFPFNVEMLSRFRTDKQQQEIVKKLASGEIDLVVGTHRMLSKDVKFKDLGLLVIDEEQRFGVEHKERIKKLKANTDVLTLSATPIPRTLHMSLIGLRDMSIIEEPPENRYPVQTYVLEQDDLLIADVIERELGRGGQIYVVKNRVSGIERSASRIRQLVPEARVAVGHGQMGERELEDVMLGFVKARSDVLVSTTIIESGLDIPNVNTIVILDADRFGLAQLYQLRGRVGRSDRMAYAYLVYKKEKKLSELAEKRLRAIREFTEFGSGFRVAMRDLELRGAGNILGAEQSGHMLSVGYELYCKLVEEAVAELKGELSEQERIPETDASIELGIAAYIPQSYISDEITRLAMYKRIASIRSEEDMMEMSDELIDRFSDIPQATLNLMDIAYIHNMASGCGVSKLALQQGRIVLQFEESNCLAAELLVKLRDEYGSRISSFEGVKPRIALSLAKLSPAKESQKLLNYMINCA